MDRLLALALRCAEQWWRSDDGKTVRCKLRQKLIANNSNKRLRNWHVSSYFIMKLTFGGTGSSPPSSFLSPLPHQLYETPT